MASIQDLKRVLREFNRKYPRPDMDPLEAAGPLNISTEYANPYPNGGNPGVYIICHNDGTILRIGKASCSSNLTNRLSGYFKWGKGKSEGVHKLPGYEEARLVYTIGVPIDRAFEAPAIEEYLINQLELPYNRVGRKKP